MWADVDSDEDERPGFGRGGRGNKDYTAPMSFVSGGIKVGDKVTKEGGDDDLGNVRYFEIYSKFVNDEKSFS